MNSPTKKLRIATYLSSCYITSCQELVAISEIVEFEKELYAICLVDWVFFSFLQVVDIALKMTSLHYQYSGLIFTLASQAITNGYPINRPIWWIDPTDPVAQTIDSGRTLNPR